MKFLEKAGLVIFSNIVLILSIIVCLLIFGWIDLQTVHLILYTAINNTIFSNVILGVCTVLILLAIKCIFFDSSEKADGSVKDGILLENEDGKLLISKDTLENLVNGVAQGFEGAENISTKVVLDKENNLKVYVTLFVLPNAIIKDLSNNIQTKVKEAIKKASDLDVKEVNVRVKNITQKKDTFSE